MMTTSNLKSALQEVLEESFASKTLVLWYDKGGTLQSLVRDVTPSDGELIKFEGSCLQIRVFIEKRKDFRGKKLIYIPELPPERSWLRDYELFGMRLDLDLSTLLTRNFGLKLDSKIKKILTPENSRRLAARWDGVMGKIELPLKKDKIVEGLLASLFDQPHRLDIGRALLTFLAYPIDTLTKLKDSKIENTFLTYLHEKLGYPQTLQLDPKKVAATILLTEFVARTNLAEDELKELLPSPAHRGFWAELASHWASTVDFQESFIKWSQKLETEYEIQNKVRMKEGLERVVSFQVIDRFLLKEIKTRVEDKGTKEILRNADYIKKLAMKRSNTPWTRLGIVKEWKIAHRSVQLLERFQNSYAKLDGFTEGLTSFVREYSSEDGWWRIDSIFRELASLDVDIDPEIRTLFIDPLKEKYQAWLQKLNMIMSNVLEKEGRWMVDGFLEQRKFWESFIATERGRIAVFLIDALRYELQMKLVEDLRKQGLEVKHHLMLASLPSITEVGMPSLLPHETIKLQLQESEIGFNIDGIEVWNRNDRKKVLRKVYGEDIAIIDLDDLRRRKLKDTRILVVMDTRIDYLGRFLSEDLLDDFDRLTDHLKREILALVQEGFGRILVATDHGFLFTPLESDIQSLSESPRGLGLAVGDRYAIGIPPRIRGSISFTLDALGFGDRSTSAIFPRGLSYFSRRGPKTKFIHGGVSLQECCIGVLKITSPKRVIEEKVKIKVILPSIITSAIFSITLQPVARTISPISRNVLVQVESKGESLATSEPVEARYDQVDLTLKLSKTPEIVEIKIKDVNTEEILFSREVRVALEGYEIDF